MPSPCDILQPPRYAVIGNPISHSLSPTIHATFSLNLGLPLEYTTLLATPSTFEDTVKRFFSKETPNATRGHGLNVTAPFKHTAWKLADHVSPAANTAQAVNTLTQRPDGSYQGDNTDGSGLIADFQRLTIPLAASRICLLGAGGATAGILAPLLAAKPACLHIANRHPEKAAHLARHHQAIAPYSPYPITTGSLAQLDQQPSFDIIISTLPPRLTLTLPNTLWSSQTICYDLTYGEPSDFLIAAYTHTNCANARAHNGLGMLIEQAADSFLIWHGKRPDTAPVHNTLKIKNQN